MVMLAKGNRSQQVTDACKKYGGFYLGSIWGPAAILAQNNIKSIECVEYPEIGHERRNGYSWYNKDGSKVLKRYEKWKKEQNK